MVGGQARWVATQPARPGELPRSQRRPSLAPQEQTGPERKERIIGIAPAEIEQPVVLVGIQRIALFDPLIGGGRLGRGPLQAELEIPAPLTEPAYEPCCTLRHSRLGSVEHRAAAR